eukprot:644987_1
MRTITYDVRENVLKIQMTLSIIQFANAIELKRLYYSTSSAINSPEGEDDPLRQFKSKEYSVHLLRQERFQSHTNQKRYKYSHPKSFNKSPTVNAQAPDQNPQTIRHSPDE